MTNKKAVYAKYLKKIKKFVGPKVRYDEDSTFIFGGEYGGQMILDVRGWGAIQNLFYRKNCSEEMEKNAGEFQDAMAQFIVDAINEKLENER